MNQPSTNHRVLCVLVDPDDLPDAVRARLRQEDIDLDHRPDVFRGLARVGQWQPGVVILGADWLTTDELGFFDQVRRAAPMARLFIFGDERRAGSAYLTLAAMRDVQPIGLESLHDALLSNMARQDIAKADASATTEKNPDFDPNLVAPASDVLNASIDADREPIGADDSIDQHGEPFVIPADPFEGLEDDVFADDAFADDAFADDAFADDDEIESDEFEGVAGFEEDAEFAADASFAGDQRFAGHGGIADEYEFDNRNELDDDYDDDRLDNDGGYPDDESLTGDEDAANESGDDAQPVRVPWLRYDERPKRIPPSKAQPPRVTTDDDDDRSSRLSADTRVNGNEEADDDPPLLSTEELEALLGEGPIE